MNTAKRKKRKCHLLRLVWILAGVLFMLCGTAGYAGADLTWVQDGIGLYTESQRQELDSMCRQFYEKNGLPIFILTVNNQMTGGSSDNATVAYIEDYADRNIAGDCVGLIINMDNRYLYLDIKCDREETRARLTDSRQRRIQDAIYDRLSASDWYGGAAAFIRQTDAEYNRPAGSTEQARESNGVLNAGLSALLAAVCTGIIFSARASRHKEKRVAVTAESYVTGGRIHLDRNSDVLVNTYVTRVARPKESSGGGTSTHHSSGGHTHSGGGSHF